MEKHGVKQIENSFLKTITFCEDSASTQSVSNGNENLPPAIFNALFSSQASTFFHYVSTPDEKDPLKLIISKLEPTVTFDLRAFYEDNIKVTLLEAKNIFQATTKQSLCPRWYLERKKRITASTAHRIVKARSSATALKYFSGSTPENNYLKYGREMEPIALQKFIEITNFDVVASGLVISRNQPWLCGTPDGIFLDSNGKLCCLEIKCPYNSRISPEIEANYILSRSSLKKTHQYFTQVQLQMYLTNSQNCHLFVFSPSDYVHLIIQRDDEFL